MMRRLLLVVVAGVVLVVGLPGVAGADQLLAFGDCKSSPTPQMPGQGLAGYFGDAPDPAPAQADPFAPGSDATVYEQYGWSGLRWENYDLGCGPDAAREPGAVIGTTVSNWVMNLPVAASALTSSLTQAAFHPSFLDVFDPIIAKISSALRDSLFATWVPVVLAVLGLAILVKARRSALATTAAAIGWALLVVFLATALFRWPIAAGHVADDTVTSTLSGVVGSIGGHGAAADPGRAVASNVDRSIFYRSWAAGTLGSTDSETARKYGPELFKAHALTWHQAALVRSGDPRGEQIIEDKKQRWEDVADQVKDEDPVAYEYLTGKRADTRVGYAFLATLAALLAVPFLLVSALLLIGAFLIVRLAVMLFPAFATLGVFPAARGIVLGTGRTVGAALVNSIIFGIGAAVTIRVLGLILDPSSNLPPWLTLVLLPLFSLIMWVALKPFRRLTTMASGTHAFGDAAGALGSTAGSAKRATRRLAGTAAAAYTGGAAAAVTADALDDEDNQESETAAAAVPDRAEAAPAPEPVPASQPSLRASPAPAPVALPAGSPADPGATSEPRDPGDPTPRPEPEPPPGPTPPHAPGSSHAPGPSPAPALIPAEDPGQAAPEELDPAPTPSPVGGAVPPPPTEPDFDDGEEVYPIYRPDDPAEEPTAEPVADAEETAAAATPTTGQDTSTAEGAGDDAP